MKRMRRRATGCGSGKGGGRGERGEGGEGGEGQEPPLRVYYVDVARRKNQIRVNLNLSFPKLACDAVRIWDVEDAKGQKTLNADRMGTLHKHPLFGGERHLAETLVRTAADAALLKAQATERVHGKKRVVGSGEGSGSEDGATGRRRRRRRRWRRLRGRRIRGEIENRTTHKRQRGREVEKHQFS
jgi:hypothetical protein